MQHVFVYGTLLFSEILEGLTGRSFLTQDAELKNFKRLRVIHGDYPAVIEEEGKRVKGKLILNVDARSMEMLRFYEGDDYNCRMLQIDAGNKLIKANVFVWDEKQELLETRDWDINIFEKQSLQDYIKFVVPDTVAEFTRLFS